MSSSFYHSFFSIFKYRAIIFFLSLTYLHQILYKNNSSVGGNFLHGHINGHSKLLIDVTNIFNIFNSFMKFLTNFNSFVDYNFIFSHSFNFNATCNDNLVRRKCILTLFNELIIVLVKLENGFFDSFDYQKFWKTVALIVCFNSFHFSRLIYRIFIISMFSSIWLKKISVLLFISFLSMLIGFLKKF